MKITEYSKVTSVSSSDLFLLDGSNGTKTILASNLAIALPGLLTSTQFISRLTMSNLTQNTTLASTDRLLVGTSSGNRAITVSNALFAMLDAAAPPETHRMIFRGKYLGSSVTTTQINNVRNGTFKDLWLGDYWTIGGKDWRIVDMDHRSAVKGTSTMYHHLVLMPDSCLYEAKMNDTMPSSGTTTGGYVGSTMYTTNLTSAKNTITSNFGSYLLTFKEYLVNSVKNGLPEGQSIYDCTVALPNEIMVFGARRHSSYINAYCQSQLALFQVAPLFRTKSTTFWLRDPVDNLFSASNSGAWSPTNSLGVRPYFLIG